MEKDLVYEVDRESDMDFILEETPSSYVAMRKVRWKPTADFKVDIRRYAISADGTEKPMKGIALTDAGADYLAWSLIEAGYGTPASISKALYDRDRAGFVTAVAEVTKGDKKFIEDYKKAVKEIEAAPKAVDAKTLLQAAWGKAEEE